MAWLQHTQPPEQSSPSPLHAKRTGACTQRGAGAWAKTHHALYGVAAHGSGAGHGWWASSWAGRDAGAHLDRAAAGPPLAALGAGLALDHPALEAVGAAGSGRRHGRHGRWSEAAAAVAATCGPHIHAGRHIAWCSGRWADWQHGRCSHLEDRQALFALPHLAPAAWRPMVARTPRAAAAVARARRRSRASSSRSVLLGVIALQAAMGRSLVLVSGYEPGTSLQVTMRRGGEAAVGIPSATWLPSERPALSALDTLLTCGEALKQGAASAAGLGPHHTRGQQGVDAAATLGGTGVRRPSHCFHACTKLCSPFPVSVCLVYTLTPGLVCKRDWLFRNPRELGVELFCKREGAGPRVVCQPRRAGTAQPQHADASAGSCLHLAATRWSSLPCGAT